MGYFYSYGHRIDLTKLESPKELEQKFKEYHQKYSDKNIKQQARIDAELGIPKVEDDCPSPFEQELIYANSRLASFVASRFTGPLEMLDAKIKAEQHFVERKYKNAIEKVENVYQAEREAAEDAYGIKDAHNQLEAVEAQYQQLYQKHGRGPIQYIPGWLYLIFALIIFLGEIPMNALVFRIFGENEVMTWIMAFVIGLAVPVVAHFIGIKLREHPQGFSWPNAIKAFISTAIIVSALYGVAVLRQAYLQENGSDLGLSPVLVHDSILFFWLNLAVLAAAIIVSYLAHDAVPGFERVEKDCKRLRKIVAAKEARRVNQLKRAAVNRNLSLDQANSEYRERLNRVHMMHGSYDQLLKEGRELESRCVDNLMQDLSKYRHENLRVRADKTLPASFHKSVTIELELSTMKEKLDNEKASTLESR